MKREFYETVNVNVNVIPIGKFWYVLAHVIVPLVLGTSVYVLFRDTSLLVFDWMATFGILDVILYWRTEVSFCRTFLPNHLLYSFPDGCWVWSMTAVYRSFWNWNTFKGGFWISLGCLLGIGSEFGQLLGWVPGHFDWWDIWYMTIGFILPCVAFKEHRKI